MTGLAMGLCGFTGHWMSKLIELGVCKSEELSTVLVAMEAFRFKLLRVFLTGNGLTFIYG